MPQASFLVVVILTAFCGQAYANYDVGTLYNYCKLYEQAFNNQTMNPTQVHEEGVCLGYIVAASEQLNQNCSARTDGASAAEMVGVPTGVAIKVFLQWAESDPATWDKPAILGSSIALSQRFPCRK
jgi:hypothetical protein